MVLAQQGDQQAYHALLHQIRPYVRAIVLRHLNQPDRADDVAQEVLLAVHTARHTWHPKLPVMPWLHGIIRYKTHDTLRQLYRQHGHEIFNEAAYETFAAPQPNTELDTTDMERMLASLTAKQRTLLTLTKVQGFTAAEAGRELGMSPTAVKVAVHRILKGLQAAFGARS